MAKFNFTQVASLLQQLFNMVESPDAEPTENSAQLVTSGGVYDAIQNASQSVETDVKDYVDEVAATKADKDGIYPDLTAGTALQLVGNTYTEDKTPYNFRKSGGSVKVGTREKDKIVGGTIAWNQWVNNGNFANGTSGWSTNYSTISAANNVCTVTPTGSYAGVIKYGAYNSVANHVYFIKANVINNTDNYVAFAISNQANYSTIISGATIAAGTTGVSYGIAKPTADFLAYVFIRSTTANTPTGTFGVKNVQVFDLTQMFGATIADYLNTAGGDTAKAFIESYFPKPYYAYNTGELMSVKTNFHKTTGFNQWDGTYTRSRVISAATGAMISESSSCGASDYIPVVGGCRYYMNSKSISSSTQGLAWYDAGKNFISGTPMTGSAIVGEVIAPDNAAYMRFSLLVSNANDICINFSDPNRNGEYEPYELHSYALDPDLELRGIPKLDANNALYYDGDIYEADGDVTRKYGIVDLGSFTWTRVSTQDTFYTMFTTYNAKIPANNSTQAVIRCGIYAPITANGYNGGVDKTISISSIDGGQIFVRDSSYTDAATFKTAMSGVYLVYELATPTTEEADPFAEIQIVSEYGTEEYVDERAVAIPVGHDTEYPTDLVAKIEEIPDPPTADGTYTLKAVVSGGVATYSWG